jgi:adenylate kinase
VYTELTAPLINFYKNKITQIDGDGTIDQVTQRILEYIQ